MNTLNSKNGEMIKGKPQETKENWVSASQKESPTTIRPWKLAFYKVIITDKTETSERFMAVFMWP